MNKLDHHATDAASGAVFAAFVFAVVYMLVEVMDILSGWLG